MAVLSADGKRVLVGRQKRWPPNWYSTLAGFVEAGESVEEAVRREVWEESGVTIGRVVLHSTQPWPYPANLMIGKWTGVQQTCYRDIWDLILLQVLWPNVFPAKRMSCWITILNSRYHRSHLQLHVLNTKVSLQSPWVLLAQIRLVVAIDHYLRLW